MALARGYLANCVVKSLTGIATMTGGATVTLNSTVLDLGIAAGTQKFTWAKFVFVAAKAGTAGVAAVTITPLTGTTSAAATAMSRFPVSVAGGTPTSGSLTSTAAGQIVAAYDIDLKDSDVRQFIKVKVDATLTASDTLIGQVIVILGGVDELPASNAAHLTTA